MLKCLWYLTPKCNYHCPYCFDQVKAGFHFPYPLKECRRVIGELSDQNGAMWFGFTGGEPSIHPLFFPLLKEVSERGHDIFVCSNLSFPVEKLAQVVQVPERCTINSSLHLAHTDTLSFSRKIRQLSDMGFHVSGSVVLYPPNLYPALAAVTFMRQNLPDVYFGGQAFFGKWDGLVFPDAYTEKDRTSILQECSLDVNARVEGTKVPYGTQCRAGVDFFVIEWNGVIERCTSKVPMKGEVFDHFSLLDRAAGCPFGECQCTDMHEYWKTPEAPP